MKLKFFKLIENAISSAKSSVAAYHLQQTLAVIFDALTNLWQDIYFIHTFKMMQL